MKEFVEVWIPILQVLVIPVVGLGWRAFMQLRKDTLGGIAEGIAEIRKINGRIVMLEQWKLDHSERCDERHDQHFATTDRIRSQVDALALQVVGRHP